MSTAPHAPPEAPGDSAAFSKAPAGRPLGRVLLFWMGLALLLVAAGAFSGMIPREWQEQLSNHWQQFVFGPVISLGCLLMTVLLVRREGSSLEAVGVALRRGSAARFAFGFFLGLVLVGLSTGILALTSGMRLAWEPRATLSVTLLTLAAFCAGACGEELGFRGYPFRKLEKAYGLWIAQAIVALAFALYHIWVGWPWLNAVVGTGTGSVLFGMAAMASRGLALPIGVHAAWGFGGWILEGFWRKVLPEGEVSNGGLSGSYLAVAGLGILFFQLWHRRNGRRELAPRMRPGRSGLRR